jgi:hypothetical protein
MFTQYELTHLTALHPIFVRNSKFIVSFVAMMVTDAVSTEKLHSAADRRDDFSDVKIVPFLIFRSTTSLVDGFFQILIPRPSIIRNVDSGGMGSTAENWMMKSSLLPAQTQLSTAALIFSNVE